MAEDQVDENKDIDEELQKLMLRVLASGHEFIPERRLYRHKSFKKSFPKGTLIKVDGVPLITPFGNTVTTDEVFPERADLCLDSDGNVLPPHTFAERYKQWLSFFKMVENTDINAEPIPDPTEWVVQQFDEYSESGGLVTIGYDAKKPAEVEATHLYDPRNDKLVEIDANMKVMSELLTKLATKELERRGPGRPPKEASWQE